jgi:hypothetical protein
MLERLHGDDEANANSFARECLTDARNSNDMPFGSQSTAASSIAEVMIRTVSTVKANEDAGSCAMDSEPA